MKQLLNRHGIWAFLTMVAWVAGSLLKNHAEIQPPKDAATYRVPQTELTLPRLSFSSSPQSSNRDLKPSRSIRDLFSQPDDTLPASAGELESWLERSVTPASPIERRLAFDQVLTRLPFLTGEEIISLRETLASLKGSAEQRKIFDYAWAAKAQESALEFLGQIPEEKRQEFLANMLPGLASTDPSTAINLFETFAKDAQRELRPSLYEGLIDHDQDLATNYVLESANPERPDWQPMDTFTRELVNEQGIDQTLEWATTLPQGSLRGNAWSAAYARWTTENPVTVAENLQAMPVSGDRDQAINGFISALAGQDPETAVIWAAEINQPGLRESALIRAGSRYFQQDPSAATEWFQSSGLPPEARDAMARPDQ